MRVTACLLALLLAACSPAPEPPGGVAQPAPDARPQPLDPAERRAREDAHVEAVRQRLADAEQAAPPADWTPPAPAAEPRDTAALLAAAQAALDADPPDPAAALDGFLAVLQDDPAQPDARAGATTAAEQVLARGEALLAARDWSAARALLPALTRARGEDARLQALREGIARQREHAALLDEARRLVAAGQLVEPEPDNAAALLRAVLRADPEHPEARAALADIERTLVTRAMAVAEAGDYAASDRLLADAARLHPGSDTVQNASTQIVELRQGRAEALLRRTQAAIDAGALDEAGTVLAELEQVAPLTAGIEDLRDRLEAARHYGGRAPGTRFRDALADGGDGPELVVVPRGRFQMGSPRDERGRKANEGPRHAVQIDRGFALAARETSVAEFRRFIEATGHRTSAHQRGNSLVYDERSGTMIERSRVTWRNDYAGERARDDDPVLHVSWNDAQAYADWLTLQTGQLYRLPSEAEFEHALRAGGQTRYPWGEEAPARLVGNVTGEGDRSRSRRSWNKALPGYSDGFWGPAPVGRFPANAFGLFDLEGNVSEWVTDCWHDSYARAPADGSAWVNPGCTQRVIRGGSWASAPDQLRSAFRLAADADTPSARVGFRVVREFR